MAWGVGANDVANAMATSVGSRAVTIKQAVLIAAVFELAGSYLAGGEVTATIRKGVVDTGLLAGNPELLVYGMLSSLLAAGIWLFVASRAGWPVSTTHTIVGAIVGFAAVCIGIEAVKWGTVGYIVLSWVVSPVMAGAIAYALFMSVQWLVINTKEPLVNARRYVPYYIFLVGLSIALVTLFKGLKHVGLNIEIWECYIIALGFGLVLMFCSMIVIRRIRFDPKADKEFHYANVEKIFAVLMMITACAMAFAHGSNDVANAVGPLAAVVSVVQSNGMVAQNSAMAPWILMLGGLGIVAGLMMYGQKVIAMVGTRITELTPSRGFAATLAATITVVLASGTGLPISTTHTLVGAVLGVGIARGIAAVNLNVVRTIFMSWVVTLPVGAILSIIFFFMFKTVFSSL